nr:hypothetical protein [Treponema sp. OMZ 788]
MISVFKKIIRFAQKERANIRKSIISGFMNAVFNALQFAAIYYVLVKIFDKTIGSKDIAVSLGILLVSLAGKMITKYISQLQQTHAGYFMAADKRIEIGEKLKKVPMGFFLRLQFRKTHHTQYHHFKPYRGTGSSSFGFNARRSTEHKYFCIEPFLF